MKIEIITFAGIKEKVGSRKVTLNFTGDATVFDVVKKFSDKYDLNLFEKGRLESGLTVALENQEITADQMNSTYVLEGQRIAVLPPTGGGSK